MNFVFNTETIENPCSINRNQATEETVCLPPDAPRWLRNFVHEQAQGLIVPDYHTFMDDDCDGMVDEREWNRLFYIVAAAGELIETDRGGLAKHLMSIHVRQPEWYLALEGPANVWEVALSLNLEDGHISRKQLHKQLKKHNRAVEAQALSLWEQQRPLAWTEKLETPTGWVLLKTRQEYKRCGRAMDNCVYWNNWVGVKPGEAALAVFWNPGKAICISIDERKIIDDFAGARNAPLGAAQKWVVAVLFEQLGWTRAVANWLIVAK